MTSARDAYEDWHDDEPYGDAAVRPYEEAGPRRLSLVHRPELAFEVVSPENFEAAQRIADRLRDGVSVLVDVGGCDAALTGRLVDFVSGLAYALDATLQLVAREVLLLAPHGVSVSGDEESAVRSPGFYNRS